MPAARPISAAVRHPSVPLLPNESRAELRKSAPDGNGREQEASRLAVEKNQVMDELLARPDIPFDYGAEMVALSHDRTQTNSLCYEYVDRIVEDCMQEQKK